MIRTGLSITKPAIATAVPVNELRRLMTTGMSAPPMGSVIVTPKISAAARMTNISGRLAVPVTNRMSAATRVIAANPAVTMRPPGIMIGLPGISPWSLPDATSDPVNVIDPMMMSSTMKMWVSSRISAPRTMRR
jgi:hypothetical protein